MTKFTGCLLLLFFTFFSFAQIEVNSEATADQVIETLVGSGVEVSNVTINCPDVSYGTFSGTSNMGIGNGIIMTSGDAKLAEGPNNEEGAYLNNFSWVEDTDLQALIPDYDIMDACVVEFDFIPAGDSLSFQYVFGSEEYPEFLEGDFNDVFGFFVSGPGIEGGFSNGARNIAVVPGTEMPVSIQTINNGSVKFDIENETTSCDGPCVNCEYFMCNGNGDNFFNEPWFYDPTFIQYNGFTTILTAGIKLIPGEKYHIKLAVADAGDSTYDTGVFLAGKSFSTNVPQLAAFGIEGEEEFPTAVAGCTDGQFIFTFKEPVLCDVTVDFEVGGTSEAGVDYTAFSNSILIPENSLSESILVEILDDGVVGEAKTLELYITSVSNEECANVILDTISLTIDDAPVFAVSDADIEKGETATIEASGGWSYMWSGSFDNPTERSQSVSPEESTDYEVTINYGRCSETLTSRVAVAGPVPECEFEVSSAVVEICNDAIYAIDIGLSGAAMGDEISVADADGNLLGSFTYNDDEVRVGPIQRSQFVLTITNDSNITCTPIEYDATDAIEDCLNPSPCSIAVTMGSIASCTRNAYDLQLMLVGTDNGDSFSVSTANGTDLGTYNYSDMPVLIADIPVDQTVLFINDTMFTDCTTQTIDIFPVVQACVNLVPLCTLIEATPTVIDCTENDFTLNLMVNSNSTGNSFRVSDNLGNSIGIYNYDDVPVTIGPLSLDVTSLTINDSGNSECTTETDDLTDDVQTCIDSLAMCSLTITGAEVTSCTEENYTLSLTISAEDAGTSFSVSDASGNDLGTYNYTDEPIEITGIAVAENVLTISDTEKEDCSTSTEDLAAAIQACIDDLPTGGDCSLSAVTATFVDCTETDYSIMLEVTGENIADSFTVSDAAGNDLGTYNYADMSVEITGIAIAESVLTITDVDDTTCSANSNDLATDIQTCLDGDPEVCTISNAIASFIDCTETEYSITLAVMGENLGDSFTVTDAAGNDLGTYNYADMPLAVSGIPVAESILTITDSESADCTSNTNDLATDIQTCVEGLACSISTAIAMVSSCTENDYAAMIMVAGENTGTSFSVSDAAGNDLGTFNYADSPVELSGLALTSNVFTITDGNDADCSATTNDLAAAIEMCGDDEPEPTCSAMAMAMLSACTETDYTLRLMVTGLNAGDSFTVTNASGTDLGTYNYADSPIAISGVALSDHVFIITDSNDSSCIATTNNIAAEIQACTEPPPAGECSVSYSDISIVECENNTFTVEVSVSGINVGETFKAVSLNGVSAGNFVYTESPHQISNLPIDQNWLYFIDNTDKSCATMVNLQDRIDTCLGGGDECTLDVSAGFLTLDNDYVCDGDSPATNLVDTTLPQGYNTYYVFHNNTNLTPASLGNTQVYAVSNSDLNLENSLIPCGTPVYMTTMIAEQTLNIADLDLSAACTTFGNTVEVVFLCPISVSIEELCNQATGLFVLNVVVKGGLPAFEAESEFDISGDVYTGNTGNEELISIVDLPDGSDYRIVATDEYGCTTEVSGNITCEKKLPVELITFTGEARQNGNLLKWSTASEIQNDFFTIEHSTDAINYTKLKVIEGAGTSNEATNYEFLDRAAANGTTYYRLSQTDFDGTSKVEGVVFITRGEDIGINIAGINPMPFVNELNIQLSSTENVFVRFSLTDLSGRLMIRNEYNLISGLTEISLDTEQLAMGIYMLRIETKTGSIVKKVVKH